MTYLFYACVCLGLIVVQTSLMSGSWHAPGIYDLMIPVVIYLGLFRRPRETLPVIVALGIGKDSLSGGPFGLYLTVYFWCFMGIRGMIRFLRVRNSLLLPVVIAAGVLLENAIFLAAMFLSGMGLPLPGQALTVFGYQSMWAFFTGPVLLLLVHHLHRRWERWLSDLLVREKGHLRGGL